MAGDNALDGLPMPPELQALPAGKAYAWTFAKEFWFNGEKSVAALLDFGVACFFIFSERPQLGAYTFRRQTISGHQLPAARLQPGRSLSQQALSDLGRLMHDGCAL